MNAYSPTHMFEYLSKANTYRRPACCSGLLCCWRRCWPDRWTFRCRPSAAGWSVQNFHQWQKPHEGWKAQEVYHLSASLPSPQCPPSPGSWGLPCCCWRWGHQSDRWFQHSRFPLGKLKGDTRMITVFLCLLFWFYCDHSIFWHILHQLLKIHKEVIQSAVRTVNTVRIVQVWACLRKWPHSAPDLQPRQSKFLRCFCLRSEFEVLPVTTWCSFSNLRSRSAETDNRVRAWQAFDWHAATAWACLCLRVLVTSDFKNKRRRWPNAKTSWTSERQAGSNTSHNATAQGFWLEPRRLLNKHVLTPHLQVGCPVIGRYTTAAAAN